VLLLMMRLERCLFEIVIEHCVLMRSASKVHSVWVDASS
jgi:hypothetical protein